MCTCYRLHNQQKHVTFFFLTVHLNDINYITVFQCNHKQLLTIMKIFHRQYLLLKIRTVESLRSDHRDHWMECRTQRNMRERVLWDERVELTSGGLGPEQVWVVGDLVLWVGLQHGVGGAAVQQRHLALSDGGRGRMKGCGGRRRGWGQQAWCGSGGREGTT